MVKNPWGGKVSRGSILSSRRWLRGFRAISLPRRRQQWDPTLGALAGLPLLLAHVPRLAGGLHLGEPRAPPSLQMPCVRGPGGRGGGGVHPELLEAVAAVGAGQLRLAAPAGTDGTLRTGSAGRGGDVRGRGTVNFVVRLRCRVVGGGAQCGRGLLRPYP